MRTVRLTTWERVTLLGCIPPSCPSTKLPEFLPLMRILKLSEDEEAAVGFVKLQGINGRERTTWTNTRYLFDVEFPKLNWRTMIRLVRDRREWPTMDESEVLLDKMEEAAATPDVKKEEGEEKEDG